MGFERMFVFSLFIFATVPSFTQPAVFKDVEARHSPSAKNRPMVETSATLILDDASKKLQVKSSERPLDVAYADVQKIIFDSRFFWCYIESRKAGGPPQAYMLRIDDGSWDKVTAKVKESLLDRVIMAEARNGEAIEHDAVKYSHSSHSVKVDKVNHPIPEVKPDKALVVAACLPMVARSAGRGYPFLLRANDQVIAVNMMGTYSFAYLDPGEYLIISQSKNSDGLKVKLDAGKDYYFLQDARFGGMRSFKTSVSMHRKEVVMYELAGAWYSDWKAK